MFRRPWQLLAFIKIYPPNKIRRRQSEEFTGNLSPLIGWELASNFQPAIRQSNGKPKQFRAQFLHSIENWYKHRFIFVLVPGLDFVISEMRYTISMKFAFDLFGTLWTSLAIFCLLLILVGSVDLSKGGNSRICIYAWDGHFLCSSALANGRRRDGGGMINSFAVNEIWRSGFVIPACSVIVSCRISSAKIVHSMYIALYTGI